MPKLPVIKDRQLIRTLKQFGFFEHRQKGTSHLIMVHRDGRRTSIPVHPGKDIPKGTLKGILKDLEIPTEEFIRYLKK